MGGASSGTSQGGRVIKVESSAVAEDIDDLAATIFDPMVDPTETEADLKQWASIISPFHMNLADAAHAIDTLAAIFEPHKAGGEWAEDEEGDEGECTRVVAPATSRVGEFQLPSVPRAPTVHTAQRVPVSTAVKNPNHSLTIPTANVCLLLDPRRMTAAEKADYRKYVAIPRYLRKRKNRDWNHKPMHYSRTEAAQRRGRSNGKFAKATWSKFQKPAVRY